MRTTVAEIIELLTSENELEYKINHYTPKNSLRTSQEEQKEAKKLWESRPSLLPEKYHQVVIDRFNGYLSEDKNVKKIIPLLSWRVIGKLKTELDVDLLPVFKEWRHEVAVKISRIFQEMDTDVKTESSSPTRWLKMISEYYYLHSDWRKASNANLIMILSVARALFTSGYKSIFSLFMEKARTQGLFGNIENYRIIERLKGNGNSYMEPQPLLAAAGPGAISFLPRYEENSELPAVMARLLNLVFRLDHAKVIEEYVDLMKKPGPLRLEIGRLASKISVRDLLTQDMTHSQLNQLSQLLPKIEYRDLSPLVLRDFINKTNIWQAHKIWFPILLIWAPSQFSEEVNREFSYFCFTLLQHLEICRQSAEGEEYSEIVQWKEQVSYRTFLHLTYALIQKQEEGIEESGAHWSEKALGKLLKESNCTPSTAAVNGQQLYTIVTALQGSGLFSSCNCAPVTHVLDYSLLPNGL